MLWRSLAGRWLKAKGRQNLFRLGSLLVELKQSRQDFVVGQLSTAEIFSAAVGSLRLPHRARGVRDLTKRVPKRSINSRSSEAYISPLAWTRVELFKSQKAGR